MMRGIAKVLCILFLTAQAQCKGEASCTDETSLLQVETKLVHDSKRVQDSQKPDASSMFSTASRATASKTSAAQPAVLVQSQPIRAASGVIQGVAGYTPQSIQVFPGEMPFPGLMMAPPPLKPDYKQVDPDDKVALAQKDVQWVKKMSTAVDMMDGQTDMALATAGRDKAWADQEHEQAIKAYDDLKGSGTATEVQLQEAKDRINLATKDLDWAEAEENAATDLKGLDLEIGAIQSRDMVWAKAELEAAKKAKRAALSPEQQEAEEEAEEKVKEEEEAKGIQRDSRTNLKHKTLGHHFR